MGTVLSHMTMSLDGYIAHPDDTIDGLFDWYGAGTVEVATANPDVSFHLDEAGTEFLREVLLSVGALVCGRRLFDLTDGWGDRHPAGVPVVVVTHQPPADAERWPHTTFAPDVPTGIARAQEIAGAGSVVVSSADVTRQVLDLGLLDEFAVSLAPILLGRGIPYVAALADPPVVLDDPVVVPGARATHLRYRVRRSG